MDRQLEAQMGPTDIHPDSSETTLIVVLGDESGLSPSQPHATGVLQRPASAPVGRAAGRRQHCHIEIEMREKHRPDCLIGQLKKQQLDSHPKVILGPNGSITIRERINIDYCEVSGDDNVRYEQILTAVEEDARERARAVEEDEDEEDTTSRGSGGSGGSQLRPSRKDTRLNDPSAFQRPTRTQRSTVERTPLLPLLGEMSDEVEFANIWETPEPKVMMATSFEQSVTSHCKNEEMICQGKEEPLPKNTDSVPGKEDVPANEFPWATATPLTMQITGIKPRVSFASKLEEDLLAGTPFDQRETADRSEAADPTKLRPVLKQLSKSSLSGNSDDEDVKRAALRVEASASDYLGATLGRGTSIGSAVTAISLRSSRPPPPAPPSSFASTVPHTHAFIHKEEPTSRSYQSSPSHPTNRNQLFYVASQTSDDGSFSRAVREIPSKVLLRESKTMNSNASARSYISSKITANRSDSLNEAESSAALKDRKDAAVSKTSLEKKSMLFSAIPPLRAGNESATLRILDNKTENSIELGNISLGADTARGTPSAKTTLSRQSSLINQQNAERNIEHILETVLRERVYRRPAAEEENMPATDPRRQRGRASTSLDTRRKSGEFDRFSANNSRRSSTESQKGRNRARTTMPIIAKRSVQRESDSVTLEGRLIRRSRGAMQDGSRTPSNASLTRSATTSATSGVSVLETMARLRMQDPCWITERMVDAALDRRRAEKTERAEARAAREQRQRERQAAKAAAKEAARAQHALLKERAQQKREDARIRALHHEENARRTSGEREKLKSDPCWSQTPSLFKPPSPDDKIVFGQVAQRSSSSTISDVTADIDVFSGNQKSDTGTEFLSRDSSSGTTSHRTPKLKNTGSMALGALQSNTQVMAFVPVAPGGFPAVARAPPQPPSSAASQASSHSDSRCSVRSEQSVQRQTESTQTDRDERKHRDEDDGQNRLGERCDATTVSDAQLVQSTDPAAAAEGDAGRGHQDFPDRRPVLDVAQVQQPHLTPSAVAMQSSAPEEMRPKTPQTQTSSADEKRRTIYLKAAEMIRRKQRARKLESERGHRASSDDEGAVTAARHAASRPAVPHEAAATSAPPHFHIFLGVRTMTNPHIAAAPLPRVKTSAPPGQVTRPPQHPMRTRPHNIDSAITVQSKPSQMDLMAPHPETESSQTHQGQWHQQPKQQNKKQTPQREHRKSSMAKMWRFITRRSQRDRSRTEHSGTE